MKKALSVISVVFLSLSLLAACNGGESETQKELAALKEQLAQQQKQQAERENQEQEHRKQIEQRQREDELYQKAYQDAQEDLQMKQMLEEEKKQEEAKKKQAAEEERKREEAKKKQALEEERKQKEETRIKQEEPRIRQEETPKATAKPTVSQQAPKVTEKLVRYPAFVISASGSGSLNLRGGPSISAVSVTQLKDGQQLQVVAETNACTNANGGCWVKVQVGGLTGYVSNAYLQKGHVRDIGYPE
ncbi:SH3 domain-containing protein [Morococcus cerebrosus]|uniref:SH3 domain-containing protein n=1 Tax=Morococcus cerebrosus TaxID=1056807 RepID=UPI000665607B|nr:SH3 domain-containing protein [Morococcus cerebrosus]